mgnify:CR=1 FL=1
MNEQDDILAVTIPNPIEPGKRFMEQDGRSWSVWDWTRAYCRCFGMWHGEDAPRPDKTCRQCGGTGEGDWDIDSTPVATWLCEDDARLLVFGQQALEACKAALDPDPCHYDHHGYCQAHTLRSPCEQNMLRNALANFPERKTT